MTLGVGIGGLGAIGKVVARHLDRGIDGLALAAVSARDGARAKAAMADFTRPAPVVAGPDPGIVYIMRSAAHALEVYKIGLTRRTATERAKDLSYETGVPLPFGVLAQWEVGDCAGIEALIHERLAAYRVNERREFFRHPLRTIVALINSVVEESTPISK